MLRVDKVHVILKKFLEFTQIKVLLKKTNNSEHYWKLPKHPNSNKFWLIVTEFYLKFWFCDRPDRPDYIKIFIFEWELLHEILIVTDYCKLQLIPVPKYQNLGKFLKILIKILILSDCDCDRII